MPPSMLPNILKRYAQHAGGSMLVVTCMLTIMLIAATSLVMDYTRKSAVEGQLQKIADSAVQAAMKPVNLPADPKEAERRRLEVVTNYLRNSGNDLSEARIVGTPEVSITGNGVSVTMQARFDGTIGAIFEMAGMEPSLEPNLAVRSEAQW